jgi:ACR3 family arsenite transporter
MMLKFCARQGRLILVASLVVGLVSSTLAELIKPHIGVLIAALLFVACLRVGPKQVLGAVRDMKASLLFVLLLQVMLPIAVALAAIASGLSGPLVFALVLLTSAPSLSGSPHLVVLMGFEPSPALRQLVVGTALLPITIIPVLLLMPEFGDFFEIAIASLKLLVIIVIAASFAFFIRLTILKEPDKATIEQIDGVSTVLLSITVVGLMAAIGEELADNPMNVFLTLGVTILANFGLQITAALLLARSAMRELTVPIGIIAGNRNIALFLTALPVATTEPLLLFIACYQIPMYLTPIVMRPFYQRLAGRTTILDNK